MRAAVGILLLAVLPTLAGAQSLGEAAKKEEERRKHEGKPAAKTHVITEEDLKSSKGRLANDPAGPTPDPSASPGAAATGASTSAAPAPAERDHGGDEAAWRARAAEARQRVAETRKTYEVLNSQYLAPGEYFVDEQGHTVIKSREHLRALIDQAKAQMEAAQKALEDLEESARHQSVPPGWLR